MKRFTVPMAVALATIFAGAAFAQSVTNTVKNVDTKNHTLTLSNGETFHLPRNYNLSRIKSGEKVTINYKKRGNQMEATEVMPAK